MSSATVRVEKATSDLLIGPDWTMNMEICDSVNSDVGQAKEVVKAVKKRLQSKNPKVQMLALTLLETMIKNCGDYVHFQVSERKILQEMTKIVMKKTDMHVRDKILVLLDSWQEAFGGPGGKHPQYYWAFDELRRSGVRFPQRSPDAAPIFTPPVTHPTARHAIAGYGMPSNTTQRLDEAMASEMETLSLSNLNSIRSVAEVLSDMIKALNPSDPKALKDDIIEDLVDQCRSNQKKLMQMLNSTVDEELLGQGLELNDDLQNLLAKHDAIASGSPLPHEPLDSTIGEVASVNNTSPPVVVSPVNSAPNVVSSVTPQPAPPADTVNTGPRANASTSHLSMASDQINEDEVDDDFAQLARRHSKSSKLLPPSTSAESNSLAEASNASSEAGKELALPNPPAPVRTASKEQDIIDLLSITLSTSYSSPPHTPLTPPVSNKAPEQVPVSPPEQGYSFAPQKYPIDQGRETNNSYVAPWAKPHFQPQNHPVQHPQYPSSYPPPPWASPEPEYHMPPSAPSTLQSYPANTSYMLTNPHRALQQQNSFPSRGTDVSTAYRVQTVPPPMAGNRSFQQYNSFVSPVNNEAQQGLKPRPPGNVTGQKPFIPSYRLFEDLIDLRNSDGSVKTGIGSTPGFPGSSGQSMVGGRK